MINLHFGNYFIITIDLRDWKFLPEKYIIGPSVRRDFLFFQLLYKRPETRKNASSTED